MVKMARIHNNKFQGCILILITLFSIPSKRFVDARSDIQNESLKTMKLKNGDVVDCVDIYKQPAFSHPLLKNHTIQVKPTDPVDQLGVNSKIEPLENVFEVVECPEGTIPIIRNKNNFPTNESQSIHQDSTTFHETPGHEFAEVSMVNGRFFGAQAAINIWQPYVELKNEASSARMSIIGQIKQKSIDFIQAGWKVKPLIDNESRFYIHWTADNFGKTGCTNFDCPGFVQINKNLAIGGVLEPSKSGEDNQYETFIKIFQDYRTGNWWLFVQKEAIGYWPRNLFKIIGDGAAARITWGGKVINHKRYGRHTSTDMGSGRSSAAGFGKAAFFRYMGFMDSSKFMKAPEYVIPYASKSKCYDVEVEQQYTPDHGKHFFYGGPGYSGRCTN